MINAIMTDIRVLARIPVAVFFTIVFPVAFLGLMLITSGNPSIGDGLRLADKVVLVTVGMSIPPLTLIALPMWIGNSLEREYLRRLRYFRVSAVRTATATMAAHGLIGAASIALNIVVAVVVFRATAPDTPRFLAYLAQVGLCLVCFMTVGCCLGFALRRGQAILPAGLLLMFSCYWICGAFGGLQDQPDALRSIASWIPLTFPMNGAFEVWQGARSWDNAYVLMTAVYSTAFGMLALALAHRRRRRFR